MGEPKDRLGPARDWRACARGCVPVGDVSSNGRTSLAPACDERACATGFKRGGGESFRGFLFSGFFVSVPLTSRKLGFGFCV